MAVNAIILLLLITYRLFLTGFSSEGKEVKKKKLQVDFIGQPK